jgi:2-oxoglutarate dehydrogenase E2 component (dihydrolipoamide succinyltransferase)
MAVELKVPSVGESITEVTIGDWLKAEGDYTNVDEPLVVVESEKANLEVPAPTKGRLARILKKSGDPARIGEIIGYIEEGEAAAAPPPKAEAPKADAPGVAEPEPRITPAARRVMTTEDVALHDVTPTGPGGRVLKEDVLRVVEARVPEAPPAAPVARAPEAPPAPTGPRAEEVVPMTPLRRTIARRLVEAQQTAALLTTFNEIDMSAVMALRKQHQDAFTERYGVKLGFMSFFVKAAIEALKEFPAINAEIRDDAIVYHNYYDIGVAVGGGRGLVVPVLRNAERMSFAEIERAIAELAKRAKDNKLTVDELKGGTFTISNGGIYGSMLSTPIVNPPQSGILGMHAIQDRPAAVDGQVVVRPMMYIALTYDHRLVDGREAVSFLRRVKSCVEAPVRMLLEV